VNRLPRWLIVALAVGPAVGLLVFYAWPLVTLVTEAVTAASIVDTLTRSSTWEVLWFTTWQAVASTVLTLLVIPTVYSVVDRLRFPASPR
jgi:thiamine transport system permease protein